MTERKRCMNKNRIHLLCSGILLGATAGLLAAQATAPPNSYLVHNLVFDLPNTADHRDLNLVNPWGVGFWTHSVLGWR